MNLLNKKLRLIVLACFLTTFISCGATKMTIGDIKIFPNAVEGVKLPELNSRISTAENLAGIEVEEKIGKFTSHTYSLSDSTNFDSVQKFYNEEMNAKGFTPMLEKPVKSSDSQILYYEKKGFLSSEKVAVVFTEIENYDTKKIYPFLTVYLPK